MIRLSLLLFMTLLSQTLSAQAQSAGSPGGLFIKEVLVTPSRTEVRSSSVVVIGGLEGENANRYKIVSVDYEIKCSPSTRTALGRSATDLGVQKTLRAVHGRFDREKGTFEFTFDTGNKSGEFWLVVFLNYENEKGERIKTPVGSGKVSNRFRMY